MSAARPAIDVVEKNPYVPQPFVFTEAALCLRDAIRAAGYPSEHLVNRVDPLSYSIVLGGTPQLIRELPGVDPMRCAIFNFEQLGSTSNIATPEYRRWLSGWLVLDYHSNNIEFLKRENGPNQLAFELPLVPSESLVTQGPEEKSVDVLFYGTMSERRAHVLRELEAMGLRIEVVAGAYGAELAPAIRRAKLVLHVHYYERALFPVARFAQPVMMGVPIVCETSVFSEHGDWSHSGIVFADYRHLADTCHDLLDSPDRPARRAQMAREFVRHIDFATPFAHVVRAFEALPLRANLVVVADEPAPLREGEEPPLSDEEIEAILAAEGASPPEAGQALPRLDVVRREPGQGRFGTWIAWVLIFFMVAGAIKAYL
jgi:hypothetical protein